MQMREELQRQVNEKEASKLQDKQQRRQEALEIKTAQFDYESKQNLSRQRFRDQ